MTHLSLAVVRRARTGTARSSSAVRLAGALVRACGAIALALVLAHTYAAVAAEPPPRSVSPLLAKQIAVLTAQGISPARAVKAIEVQGKVAQAGLVEKLQLAMGADYAGVWAEPRTARLHVGVTSPASRRTAERVVAQTGLAADVRYARVRSTSAQLLAAQDRWSNGLAGFVGPDEAETGLEPQHNAVSVTLSSSVPAAGRAALERAARAASVNVIVTSAASARLGLTKDAEECNNFPPANCNPSITAGVEIWSKIKCEEREKEQAGARFYKTAKECEEKKVEKGPGGKWERLKAAGENPVECTAGPAAIPTANNKERVFLTAGHCLEIEPGVGVGIEWFASTRALAEPLIGKAIEFFDGGKINEKIGDYGDVKIEAAGGWQTGNANKPVLAVTAEWNKTAKTRYAVKGEKLPVVNNTSCHSGKTSGESCGLINGFNKKNPEAGEPTAEGLVEVIEPAGAEKRLIGEPGDSGGPWMFVEANNEVLMEGIYEGRLVPECPKVAKQKGRQFFGTKAECENTKLFAEKEGNEGEFERRLRLLFQPLKKPEAALPEGALEKLKLNLLTTANEALAPAIKVLPGETFPLTVEMTSGETKFETVGKASITCTADNGLGTLENGAAGTATFTFTGCKKEKVACRSENAKAEKDAVETILAPGTKLNVVNIKNAAKELEGGIVTTLVEPVKILCAVVKAELRGSVVGLVTPINKEVLTTESAKVELKQKEGKQEGGECQEPTEVCEKLKKEPFEAKILEKLEGAGMQSTETLKLSKMFELSA
jgi:hypothetical protein